MTINEIREKYLKFFEERGHKIISPAPLVLENDPTTLFTSSGMQPLVPYLMGEPHPEGKRLVDSQPAIRLQDIEEVGDTSHTTFFEMLGNWSLGDYFKKEQLNWVWEFMTKELGLDKKRLAVTVSAGGGGIPEDRESYEIWKKIGVSEDRIFKYPIEEENWWSRSGKPDQMPIGEIGGPDSEIFFEFTQVKHDPKFGEKCHPNCDCGRFLEIGNSVFMQYKKEKDGFSDLPNKNIDFGGGLERLAAATNNDPDVFKIDVFEDVIKRIEELTGKKYEENKSSFRVIADHMRAVIFLEYYGVEPSNKAQGYIMRRLIRRSAIKVRDLLEGRVDNPEIFTDVIEDFYVGYRKTEMFFERNVLPVEKLVSAEVSKFIKTLEKGLKEVEKIDKIDAKKAFDLYQTYGFPLEITEEIFEEKGQHINKDEFKKEFERHQELSRTASTGTFKGGLADHSGETTQLHTATHLLHESLRRVLGEHVQQKGSNITKDRLRFDFTYDKPLTDEEIKKVEDIINDQIDKKLSVGFEVMTLKEADERGALHFFDKKYDEQVKVYSIGDFSKEVCGGPHVNNTSEISGHVKITKEKSASSGVRRVYAEIK